MSTGNVSFTIKSINSLLFLYYINVVVNIPHKFAYFTTNNYYGFD